MYGLMIALFVGSLIYYCFAILDFVILFMQVVADNPEASKTFSFGHLVLIIINIYATVISSMYLFGGVR